MLRSVNAIELQAEPAAELPDVSATLRDVRDRGDVAVACAAARFGDSAPRAFVPADMFRARAAVDTALAAALENAAARIRTFAELQRASLRDVGTNVGGFELSHRAIPVRAAGIYVPAGRYPLVSSLLMGIIPARVAGVDRVIVCTPDASETILAAASIAGAGAVHQIGGAQAIAAMAYGTESVPKVDTIAGPGNRYVAAAKRAVTGICGVDAVAGPSELVVVASHDADARLVASDLLAQAEHDIDARVALLTESSELADEVDLELARQLDALSTKQIARESIERNGCRVILPLEDAIDLANALAPEHLELQGLRAEALAPLARSYGALFIGAGAAEAFGDYGIGPSHVLPTAGTARFSSGLSVFAFLTVRTTVRSVASIDPEVIETTAMLASVEGLDGHRRAALARSSEMLSRCL